MGHGNLVAAASWGGGIANGVESAAVEGGVADNGSLVEQWAEIPWAL